MVSHFAEHPVEHQKLNQTVTFWCSTRCIGKKSVLHEAEKRSQELLKSRWAKIWPGHILLKVAPDEHRRLIAQLAVNFCLYGVWITCGQFLSLWSMDNWFLVLCWPSLMSFFYENVSLVCRIAYRLSNIIGTIREHQDRMPLKNRKP